METKKGNGDVGDDEYSRLRVLAVRTGFNPGTATHHFNANAYNES
jgi:hypothetical protein